METSKNANSILASAFLQNTIENNVIAVKAEDVVTGSGIDYSKHFFEAKVGSTYLIKFLPNPGGEPITHRAVYKKLPDPERKGKTFQLAPTKSSFLNILVCPFSRIAIAPFGFGAQSDLVKSRPLTPSYIASSQTNDITAEENYQSSKEYAKDLKEHGQAYVDLKTQMVKLQATMSDVMKEVDYEMENLDAVTKDLDLYIDSKQLLQP